MKNIQFDIQLAFYDRVHRPVRSFTCSYVFNYNASIWDSLGCNACFSIDVSLLK